jgi:rhamnulose-1-phosphate aldolase
MVQLIGEAGVHLAEIGASEGSAGNISVLLRWPVPDVRDLFPYEEPAALPLDDGETAAPELAGATLIVTGSGRRLREIARSPGANLAVLQIGEDGKTARLFTARARLFARPTSELVSHVGIHRWAVSRTGTNFHAVVHAQPLHVVYLSHLERYQDTPTLNRHLLRWQPETIHNLPEGVAFTPFTTPGTADLMRVTLQAMEHHRVVLWAKHGLIVRSDTSVKKAVDLTEYVETAARYEYLNLVNGDRAQGLTPDEMRRFCAVHGIQQRFF